MAEHTQAAPMIHSFRIETELSGQQLLSFPRFMLENLSFGQLPGIRMGPVEAFASSKGHYIEFTGGPDRGEYRALVRMFLERPIAVELRSSMGRNEDFEKQLENVLLITLQFFEEEARKSTLYLAFLPGSPRTAKLTSGPSIVRRLFMGNMLNLFLLSIVIGIVIFLIVPEYAPYILIALMMVLVLSAGKIASLHSPWRITKDSREVVLVQHKVPAGEIENYRTKYKSNVSVAKQKAYDKFSTCPGLVCADTISAIFSESGLPADQNDFLVRRVDLYGIVERAATKFNMPVPTIVVTQDPNPNAAASGFTRGLATMLVTMGLLVQLDEEEVEVVVGHELSHLHAGDPLVLFSLVVAEYMGRLFVWGSLIGSFVFVYLLAVFWCIFFVGKFLESRADLEAAVILGKPRVMAESLKKIGFRRLVLQERFLEPETSRFGEWLRFDPHPPLYFRIKRLEELDPANPPKHPFLSSVRAVAHGLMTSGKAH
ncbi:MAG TPA: M56 family metallopeptidase [Thermoplasmata archaeon]